MKASSITAFTVMLSLLIVFSDGVLLPCAAADLQLEGFRHVKSGNFSKAIECFSAALKIKPDSWQMLQSVGICQMELEHYDTAIGYLQKSIEVGGLHASQCHDIAAVYQRSGQPKKSLSWLELECSINPARASDPSIQAMITRLQDPEANPTGSLTAPDYLSSQPYTHKWRKQDMPLKVYVRKNIQIPEYYEEFVSSVKSSLDQWCRASGNAISYELIDSKDVANIICDYTSHRELVSSKHELGMDGITESLVRTDLSVAVVNITVLVKDSPLATTFRSRALVTQCCCHELGHALGIQGHSPNPNDVMYPAAPVHKVLLSERDKNTIRKMYQIAQGNPGP